MAIKKCIVFFLGCFCLNGGLCQRGRHTRLIDTVYVVSVMNVVSANYFLLVLTISSHFDCNNKFSF